MTTSEFLTLQHVQQDMLTQPKTKQKKFLRAAGLLAILTTLLSYYIGWFNLHDRDV